MVQELYSEATSRSVIPGQGVYHDPVFINPDGRERISGYVTDIITDKTINFLSNRNESKPFFVMCHHKAPHRSWEYKHEHRHLYQDDVKIPETFTDDYKNRAKAAKAAKMRVAEDMTFFDLGLAQPEGGSEVGEPISSIGLVRKIPYPEDVTKLVLVDNETGENFRFKTRDELREFKYQRYIKRYCRCVHSIDENVGRLLDYINSLGKEVVDNTLIMYTSDQGKLHFSQYKSHIQALTPFRVLPRGPRLVRQALHVRRIIPDASARKVSTRDPSRYHLQ